MTWLVGMHQYSQRRHHLRCPRRRSGLLDDNRGCSIPSPKRLFAAGILLDKVDCSMARRGAEHLAEQQADTTGRHIWLAEEGLTRCGDASWCKAATTLRNIQGYIVLFDASHDNVDGEHGGHVCTGDVFPQPQLSSLLSSPFEQSVQCGRLARETPAEKKRLEAVRHPRSSKRACCC
ncbi:uncharacterized protein LOC125945473 isoform X2 [Dermacentor silvarum]|uniref:uncharacterized protein LOC125945473 isoform X2 n=1 Tax=Dermacentor silvarum TaxID=543639 RepID=UPI002101922D|nr:uncharacterized protein LOC125945473 isoform X2 [Dermacentor silvarum]